MMDMPFSVDGLSTFCVLLGPDVLLDDLRCSLSADLFMFCQLLIEFVLSASSSMYLCGVWLGGTLEEVLNTLSNSRHVWF